MEILPAVLKFLYTDRQQIWQS